MGDVDKSYLDIDADELVENIERTGEANPEPEKVVQEAPEKLVFDSPDSLMGHKLKYTANGKEVEEDLATILKRASAGYNYAQSMNQFKGERAEFEKQQAEIKQMADKWSRYESYAQENPDWYQHWSQAWEKRGAAPGDAGEIEHTQLDSVLDQKLQPIQQFINQQQAAEQRRQMEQEDQALADQIKSTRDEHPSIDFDRSDPETGKTLEDQVLEYAYNEGLNDFNKAFKVFYHDKLIASKIEEEKAKWAKDQEDQRKRGIIGDAPTYKADPDRPNLSKMTWDQLTEMAGRDLQEMKAQ